MSRSGIDSKSQSLETVLMLEILREYMKSRTVQLGALYRQRSESFSQQYFAAHGPETSPEKAAHEVAMQVMTLLLPVCQSLCRESEALNTALCAETGLQTVASGFATGYGKGAAHWLSTQLVPDSGKSSFGASLLQAVQAQKSASGSFFSKLFGKKK